MRNQQGEKRTFSNWHVKPTKKVLVTTSSLPKKMLKVNNRGEKQECRKKGREEIRISIRHVRIILKRIWMSVR
jgi:hypothetical protein